jgi:thioesterase domain-containing protein
MRGSSRVDPAALRELTPQRWQIFEDPTLGWSPVAAGGVEVHAVPGSHMAILEAPHVETLAVILGACLARAGEGPGTACPIGRPAARSLEVCDVLVPG